MSLLDTLQGWFTSQSNGLICHTMAPAQVDNPKAVSVPLVAGEDYFRLWLAEMRLAHDRQWFEDWYPAIHSLVRFKFGDAVVDIPRVAGSLNLPDIEKHGLDTVVSLNHELTTLLPFNGGTVELSAGLLAMQGTQHLNTLIKVVGDFSSLLASPPVSAALAVAEPVARSVADLLASSNGGLHVGLHQTFAGAGGQLANALAAGFIAVIRSSKPGTILPTDLRVEGDSLKIASRTVTTPLPAGHSYMLFKIERRANRDDWDSLSTIKVPFSNAKRALRERNPDRAEDLIREAVLMALESHDLTRADRTRVAQQVKSDFDAAKAAGLGVVAGRRSAPAAGADSLAAAMQSAVAPDKALAGPPVTFRTLFQ